jgi:hypothetical protein
MLARDEVVADVVVDGFLKRRGGSRPSGGAEAADIGAGVVLDRKSVV